MGNPNSPQSWPAYIWGIIALFIGIFVLALMLSVSEEQTASALSDWLALAYMLGGKWGPTALLTLLAAVFFGLETRNRRRRQRSPEATIRFDAGDDH